MFDSAAMHTNDVTYFSSLPIFNLKGGITINVYITM
jgi:hypothetical protein